MCLNRTLENEPLARLSAQPPAGRAPARLHGGGLFKSLATRGLRHLTGGRVTVVDGAGEEAFGLPAAEARLQAEVRIADPRTYRHLVLGGSLGAAESYIRGYWAVDDLTTLLRIFARNIQAADRIDSGVMRLGETAARVAHWLRANTRAGSRRNIGAHYDLGNDFFSLMLDETMAYSCGIFESPSSTLREASVAKFERVCRKLDLGPSDHLLEIGTGWGGLAIHAAGRYGCRVTTTTISREQHDEATRRVRAAGLADRVTVLLQDYRDLDGTFDKLVSIEMVEAVGHRFLPRYFSTCCERLRPDGLALIQAITMPDHRYERYRHSVDFIQRYIFPGSLVPSLSAMSAAMASATDFRLVHLEDLTPHYATTLRRWRENVARHAAQVRAAGYSEGFLRTWEYYLCYCEAGFAERYTGDIQMVLARPGSRRTSILPALS